MRVHSILFLSAVMASGAAIAGSTVVASPSATQPSVMRAPVRSGHNSFVSPAATAATPSIVAVPDIAPRATPSILAVGTPSEGPASSAGGDGGPEIIRVIRGGETGQDDRPDATGTPPEIPLLDPNDRGTPAKRNALKRQQERLAREAAEAARQGGQQPPAP